MDTTNNDTKPTASASRGAIGLFDSGFGGLSIFREIHRLMPDYDYIFLGDNGRAPYGNRPFSEVLEFTLQAVERLFEMGCPLVILACNTASAKALRNIQQLRLPFMEDPTRRVLGVIRPTVEQVGAATRNGHIGLVATRGTIESRSYSLELEKLQPEDTVTGHACPQWVPLIESGELDTPELRRTVGRDLEILLSKDPEIDTLILGCTHYPLIRPGTALPGPPRHQDTLPRPHGGRQPAGLPQPPPRDGTPPDARRAHRVLHDRLPADLRTPRRPAHGGRSGRPTAGPHPAIGRIIAQRLRDFD
jgi:glutamate racemase